MDGHSFLSKAMDLLCGIDAETDGSYKIVIEEVYIVAS